VDVLAVSMLVRVAVLLEVTAMMSFFYIWMEVVFTVLFNRPRVIVGGLAFLAVLGAGLLGIGIYLAYERAGSVDVFDFFYMLVFIVMCFLSLVLLVFAIMTLHLVRQTKNEEHVKGMLRMIVILLLLLFSYILRLIFEVRRWFFTSSVSVGYDFWDIFWFGRTIPLTILWGCLLFVLFMSFRSNRSAKDSGDVLLRESLLSTDHSSTSDDSESTRSVPEAYNV
jgi:hypothetical protein